jgi:hypothetical protein
MVIGHWSLVIGHWSLVIGHWSLGDDLQKYDKASVLQYAEQGLLIFRRLQQ